MISLRPAFEQAARQGKLVYYPLDMHWNEEGRKIAASVTAEALRALLSEKRDKYKSKGYSDKATARSGARQQEQ